MFLLRHNQTGDKVPVHSDLHSNMFLLRQLELDSLGILSKFTFQYVSIKTWPFSATVVSTTSFTFQYVSIKTQQFR